MKDKAKKGGANRPQGEPVDEALADGEHAESQPAAEPEFGLEVETPPPPPPPEPKMPTSVELAAPYGFDDEAGVRRMWAAGQVVTDASDVRTLVERAAPVIAIWAD